MFKIIIVLFTFCCISFSQSETNENVKSRQEEEEEFSPYEGKIIRTISIRSLDVSGPSVEENNGNDTSWFAEFVNSLHYKTRDWVVKNYLLFREGSPLDVFELSESERLLRESQFFLDARIKVTPSVNKDSVDLTVITKDRWTLILQLSYNAQTNSYMGLRDDNLLGLGHKVEGIITHDNNSVTGWGTKLSYTANNIAATFVDAAAGFEMNRRSSIKTLDISRPFVSVKTRFAGGLNLQLTNSKLLYVNTSGMSLIPFSSSTVDIWGGYSFPVWFGADIFRKRTNIITAARMAFSNYHKRPFVSADSNRIFANNSMFLASTGIINRRFYRDHYIDKSGPTEDIPVGGMLSFTGGYDLNEFAHRYYAGIEAVYSRKLNEIGYFSIHTAAGGFYNRTSWEQNAYSFDILYHSGLTIIDGWKYRFFVQNEYLIGNNRIEQEQVFLDTENGMRGYERFLLHGISKGLLKLEARIFSPFQPLGFALGANIFTDLGIISDRGENLFNSRVYQSYGAGLKIRNESISDVHFDIALVFRPFIPGKNKGSFAVLFTSSLLIGTRLFNFSKPSTVNYGEN